MSLPKNLEALLREEANRRDPEVQTKKFLAITLVELEAMNAEQFGETLERMITIADIIAAKIEKYEKYSCKALLRWKQYLIDLGELGHLVAIAAEGSEEKHRIFRDWAAKYRPQP